MNGLIAEVINATGTVMWYGLAFVNGGYSVGLMCHI